MGYYHHTHLRKGTTKYVHVTGEIGKQNVDSNSQHSPYRYNGPGSPCWSGSQPAKPNSVRTIYGGPSDVGTSRGVKHLACSPYLATREGGRGAP